MPNKPFWQSKTIWLQLITILSAFIPSVQEFIAGNPVTFVTFLGAIGTVVRFLTSGKISILGD